MPKLLDIYKKLERRFGFQNWWPGETPDEIIIGAILTQNTNWRNVERAISNLKKHGSISLESIYATDAKKLARLVRPSGFYKQKAKRLKSFASHVHNFYGGSLADFFSKDAGSLRRELLSMDGIGKETADSIILYAAEKPVFVVDAYTKRVYSRVYGLSEEPDYDSLQKAIESEIPRNVRLYKDFHAQIVELAKNYCRKMPLCTDCPLRSVCIRGKSGEVEIVSREKKQA